MSSDMDKKIKIGFIGAGNMAQAIGNGIIEKKIISPAQVFVSAPSERNFKFWRKLGVTVTHNNHEVVLESDVIFLAMKPQYLDEALKELRIRSDEWTFSKLIVSMIVGVTFAILTEKLKPIFKEFRLIRIMPNTSLFVGEGFTPICPDVSATEDDITTIRTIMSAGGLCEIIPESLMSPVGVVSGSGCAFVYQIIEAISDGAVKQGVPRAMSYKLAAQTLLGAAQMVLTTNQHPAVLKDNVASPGGTTICGLHALEKGGLRYIFEGTPSMATCLPTKINQYSSTKIYRATIIDAIEASVKRTEEISQKMK